MQRAWPERPAAKQQEREAMSERDRRFFVAHMQKTAGTTLRDRLRASFTDEQIYPNASDGPDARTAVISVSHLQERWAARGDRIRLLTGHFPVRTAELLGVPFVTMTVLRHPVDRTLSFLRHQAERRQRGATEDTPLVEIYEDPFRFTHMIQNHMVRTLSLSPEEMVANDGVLTPVAYTPDRLERAKEALAGLDLFGLQDRFEEFCDELAAGYGLDVGTPLRTNTTQPGTVPDGLADRIAEDNALDMELYDHACRLYGTRGPRARPSEQLDVAQGEGPVVDAPAGRSVP
jgi:Sulfotransferase family